MYLHLDMLDLLNNFSFQYFDVHHLYYVTVNLLVLMHFSIVADSFFELFLNQWLYSYFLYFVYHFSLYPECFYFLVLPLQFVTIINLKPTTMNTKSKLHNDISLNKILIRLLLSSKNFHLQNFFNSFYINIELITK